MNSYNVGVNNPMYGIRGKDNPSYGSNNHGWKGDNVGYEGIHNWIRKYLPKRKSCQKCKKVKPLERHNISGKYLRDFKDWEWLCRRCHMIVDGRLENCKKYSIIKARLARWG